MMAFQLIFILGLAAIGVALTSPLFFWGRSCIKKMKIWLGRLLCLPTLFFGLFPVLWFAWLGCGALWMRLPSHVFTKVFGREALKDVCEIRASYDDLSDYQPIYLSFKGDHKTFERLVRLRNPEGGRQEGAPFSTSMASLPHGCGSRIPDWWQISGATEKVALAGPDRKDYNGEIEELYWWPNGQIVYRFEGME